MPSTPIRTEIERYLVPTYIFYSSNMNMKRRFLYLAYPLALHTIFGKSKECSSSSNKKFEDVGVSATYFTSAYEDRFAMNNGGHETNLPGSQRKNAAKMIIVFKSYPTGDYIRLIAEILR